MTYRLFFLPVLALFTASLLLTACGFTPMYGKSDRQRTVAPQLSLIEIGAIQDEAGQKLRNALIDQLYPNGRAANYAPRAHLTITLTESKQGLAISQDATVTRQQLIDTADFTLTDINTHAILLQRHLFVTSGYNVLGSQFSTLIAEQDARDRNIQDLAERMVSSLSLYYSNPAGTVPVAPAGAPIAPLFDNGGLPTLAPAPGFTPARAE